MIAKTVGHIKEYLEQFPDDMPLYERFQFRVVRVHQETSSKGMYHTFCYDTENKDYATSTYGCCERAKQLKLEPPIEVVRISSI